jgi:hypothetical protein
MHHQINAGSPPRNLGAPWTRGLLDFAYPDYPIATPLPTAHPHHTTLPQQHFTPSGNSAISSGPSPYLRLADFPVRKPLLNPIMKGAFCMGVKLGSLLVETLNYSPIQCNFCIRAKTKAYTDLVALFMLYGTIRINLYELPYDAVTHTNV